MTEYAIGAMQLALGAFLVLGELHHWAYDVGGLLLAFTAGATVMRETLQEKRR